MPEFDIRQIVSWCAETIPEKVKISRPIMMRYGAEILKIVAMSFFLNTAYFC